MTKAERARQLRYKKPALINLGYQIIINRLDEMMETCYEVRYTFDSDEDTVLAALDDDEEELYEFKMAFSYIEDKISSLSDEISQLDYYGFGDLEKMFDYCTVALIGNRYQLVGFDDAQEDYFSLCGYEKNLAETEAGNHLMRLTKKEMISTIGQCMGITLAFQDIEKQYSDLEFTMNILKDENTTVLKAVKKIDELYDALAQEGFLKYSPEYKEFQKCVEQLPDRLWLE